MSMKLSEALERYKSYIQLKDRLSSVSTYYNHLRNMVLYFRNCDLEKVTLQEILDHLNLMVSLGWDSNGFGARCSAYRDFFNFYKKQGLSMVDPDLIPIPQIERKMPEVITDEEHNALLKVVSKNTGLRGLRGRLALLMFYDTGMRLNEFRSLDVKDVDTKRMMAVIRTEKAKLKNFRSVFWTKETNKVLVEYIKLREGVLMERGVESEALFLTAYGRWKNFGKRWSDSAIDSWFGQISREAKLERLIHPHMYRHAFGRKLSLGPKGDGVGGANAYVIKNMMGHANVASSEIYTVMNEEMMSKVHRRFFNKR